MQFRYFSIPVLSIALAALVSCGAKNDSESRIRFITFGPGVEGLQAAVKQNEIKICLSGAVGNDFEKWNRNIQRAVLSWIQPLRSLTSEPLAQLVSVVGEENGCDASVIVTPGQWAMTEVTNKPVVNVDSSGQFSTYNVLLHEFGHAFALSDTYQGGQSGNCQAGQPQAVMCNTSFSELQSDDIKGVQEVYQSIYPNDKPGNNQGTDPILPQTPPAIFAAIEENSIQTAFKLLIAVNETATPKVTEVSYCLGLKSDCVTDGNWLTASKIQAPQANSSGRFFRTDASIAPSNTENCTIKAKTSSGFTYQTIRFKKR